MNTRFRFWMTLLIFCFAGSASLFGQRPLPNSNQDPNQNPIGNSETRDSTDSEVLPLDTPVAMTYVLISDPNMSHSFSDSFQWNDNKHNPLLFHLSHLGNYGSPTRNLAPAINLRNGFYTGWDQYDPYYVDIDSFRFYNQDIPVAKIKYSQASQEDTYVSVDFGRSFARGLNLSLTYNRINQFAAETAGYQFAHQMHKSTAFGIGLWHDAPSGKYDAFYNFISNGTVGQENGGIDSVELLGNSLFPNPNIPVNILSGVTTHKNRLFTTRQILHLASDSSNFGIDLWMQGHYATTLFKYVDPEAMSISDYYGSAFLVDQRGIRQFTYKSEYQIAGGIALPWRAAQSMLQASLRFRSINLEQEPIKRSINELYLDVSGKFHWIKAVELQASTSLGIGQANGAFTFNAKGILNSGIIGSFEGYWSVMTRKPSMIEDRLFINQQLVYDFELKNPFTTEFGIGWIWNKQKLKAGIKWIVFDNYIFFDSNKMPAQIDQSFSLQRFYISKEFDFKWIGIHGTIMWQPDVKEELAAPELLYTTGLYGRIKIFQKKVTLMPGMDITYHNQFRGVSYFPVIGRYHLTDNNNIPEYFRIDASIGVHINFLKAFVRLEDITGLFKSRVLYQADYYPHYPGYFRVGIEAGFYN